MKKLYRNAMAKKKVLELYDQQLAELHIDYKDIYLETSYGKTHLLETGNLKGKPLLVFHGGNATSAFNLKYCGFLLDDFHIYAVDTMGHPGKGAETFLPPSGHSYGEWASEVITKLGFESITCFASSFGAGVLVKLMCVAPQKVKRSMLLVPSGIKNAATFKSINMMFPMIMYWITGQQKWFVKCILPMALKEENIPNDLLITAQCSIDNCRIKAKMPCSEKEEWLAKYQGPVYIMAAQKDCLFPGDGVIKKAKHVWKDAKVYLLKDRGHINELTKAEIDSILDFLKED